MHKIRYIIIGEFRLEVDSLYFWVGTTYHRRFNFLLQVISRSSTSNLKSGQLFSVPEYIIVVLSHPQPEFVVLL